MAWYHFEMKRDVSWGTQIAKLQRRSGDGNRVLAIILPTAVSIYLQANVPIILLHTIETKHWYLADG